MRFVPDEVVTDCLGGATVLAVESPLTCCVRLGSCDLEARGDELRLCLPEGRESFLQTLKPGEFVWVVYRRGEPVDLCRSDE